VAEIRVPTLNTNDDAYVLLDWLAADGDEVRAGDSIAEVETSKTVDVLDAEADGPLRHLVSKGSSIMPGQIIARVGAGESDGGEAAEPPAVAVQTTENLITAPARARMAELGIDEADVLKLGLAVVRRSDIDAMKAADSDVAAPESGSDQSSAIPLSRNQQGVGRTVERSHATIPAAYTVIEADVGAAVARASKLMREVRRPVGLVELVVVAVAALHARFPLFFGRLDGDGRAVHPAESPRVGVTFDLGAGLFIPVVRDAATRPLREVAEEMAALRVQAAEGTFRAAELEGANFVVTLHTEPDVIMAVPFVFPGHVCALALTGPRAEPVVDEDGAIVVRTMARIGLAYDHRVVNGREAAEFLNALKQELG
jgi:2-oxoglutarate dehydrogenase E2 component (dihydrolipoamide succinyltransferase)